MTVTHGPVGRSEIATSDADLARELLDDAYGSTLRLAGDLSFTRFARIDGHQFMLDSVELDAEVRFDADPMRYFTILEGVSGWSVYTRRGVTDEAGPRDVVAVGGRDEPYHGRSRMLAARVVNLTWELLESVARDLQGEGWTASPRFLAFRPTDPSASLHWRRLSDYVEGLVTDELPASAMTLRSLGRMLAHTALLTFPNDVLEVPVAQVAQDRRDGTSTAVRRAVAFIDAAPSPEVTLAEIAAAAYVTPRALQIAFRRHLGTTPMAYARRGRLDRARQDLITADGAVVTVTAVAARWGFHNHGRFAADYRAAYGEYPSKTLER